MGSPMVSVAAPSVAISSSASVSVRPGYALTCTARPSDAATSSASRTRPSLLPAPRLITGPAPSLTSPASSLAPAAGVSLQKSPSSTTSTSGRSRRESALAPMNVVSSWTVANPASEASPGCSAYRTSARMRA